METKTNRLSKDKISEIGLNLRVLCSKLDSPETSWDSIRQQITCDELLRILDATINGKTFVNACSESVIATPSELGQILFGPLANKVSINSKLGYVTACDNLHRLEIRIDSLKKITSSLDSFNEIHAIGYTTILLDTNFQNFIFRRYLPGHSVLEPFLRMDLQAIIADISLVGSLWSLIFPSHRAIITRTIAFSVPRSTKVRLFNPNIKLGFNNSHHEQYALDSLKKLFESKYIKDSTSGRGLKLISLEEVRIRLSQFGKTASIITEIKKSKHVVRQYAPPHSKILHFSEDLGTSMPTRSDYAISYHQEECNKEFHRDFFVSPDNWTGDEIEFYKASFDILHVLSIRRSGLFRLEFAHRVYSILFPPAVLQIVGRPTDGIFIIPCLILYQVPQKGTFRRTFTVTNIAIPVNLDDTDPKNPKSLIRRIGTPRLTCIDELRSIREDLKSPIINIDSTSKSPLITCEGPLADLINLSRDPYSIPQLSEKIFQYVVSRMFNPMKPTRAMDLINSLMFTSSIESRLTTILLQVEWATPPGDSQPWERWLTTGNDTSVRDTIYKLLFYDDFLDPQSGYTSKSGVDLTTMLVGNKLRTDMNGMTFFDPSDEHKLIIYPRLRERYPNYSIVRWMAFSLYAESALSSLHGMIHQFYSDLNRQEDLQRIVDTLEEMIENFAELYDLDISRYLYRQEYEKLRELLNVNRDYEVFEKKFQSIKDSASLREQRLFNKLLLAFTVSTLSVAIIGTLAQNPKWIILTAQQYLGATLIIAIILTIASYLLFDRVRRLFSRRK